MSEFIQIDVLGNETLGIQGVEFKDKKLILDKVLELLKDCPDCKFLINPKEERFYKGIRKAITAVIAAEVDTSKIYYQPDDGGVVPILQLESRQP